MSTTTLPVPAASASAGARMKPVMNRAKELRLFFEIQREFIRTGTTLVPRVGEPDLKYRLCEHVWEGAQSARFFRERGRELTGFGSDEAVRPQIRKIFEEAIRQNDIESTLQGFYLVIKPAILRSYQSYLEQTHSLGDWPTTQLLKDFVGDEKRHLEEMEPFLTGPVNDDWIAHLKAALSSIGGWLGDEEIIPVPKDFWRCDATPYTHPSHTNRGRYPTCGCNFGTDIEEYAVCPILLDRPNIKPEVIRVMIFIWLFNEMDAVDYLSTVFYETPHAPFDLHYDLTRHLWDESRHSEFGYKRLPKLGIDLNTVEQQVSLYNIFVQMQPHERYTLMTLGFEAGGFEIKGRVMDKVRELDDFEADTLLAFDRMDEQNHVRYGHRWVPTMMELFGEKQDPKIFLEGLWKKFEELSNKIIPNLPHTLPKDKRLTAARILERF